MEFGENLYLTERGARAFNAITQTAITGTGMVGAAIIYNNSSDRQTSQGLPQPHRLPNFD